MLLVLLGIALCVALGTIDLPHSRDWAAGLVRSYALAWGCYLAAAVVVMRSRSLPRWVLAWIIVVAVVAHVAVYAHRLPMSTDDHRYLWDGRVANAGINPYLYPPSAPELQHLRDANWQAVWFRTVHTVYPPFAELLFAGLARVRGTDLAAFTWAFIGCNVGCTLLLLPLLRRTGRRAEQAIWFAWNPLPILETASGGHVDSVGVFLLLLALLLAARRGRPGPASAIAYAASVLSKGPVALAWPFFAVQGRWRFLAAFAVTVAVIFLPFLSAGKWLVSGMGFYLSHWETNASAAFLLRCGLDRIAGTEVGHRTPAVIAHDIAVIRMVTAVALLGLIAWLVRGRRPGVEWLLSSTFVVLAAQLLLGAPVLPWYVLWTVPFLCWWPVAGWVLFTLTVFAQYYGRLATPGCYPLPILLGYVPVYACAGLGGVEGRETAESRE